MQSLLELVQTGVTGHTAFAEKEHVEASISSRITGLQPAGAAGGSEAAVSGNRGHGREPIRQITTLNAREGRTGRGRQDNQTRTCRLLLQKETFGPLSRATLALPPARNLTKGVEATGGSEVAVSGNQGVGEPTGQITTLNA